MPSTIQVEEGDSPLQGKAIITPCYHGYGTTLGNALRRVLLSSLPGAAVTAFKIQGSTHEFSTVDGVKEDVVDIMLNLKQLNMRVHSEEPVVIKLSAKGKGAVKASQIDVTSDVEIMNKDLVIATITDDSAKLEMEITVQQGRGYVPVEEREEEQHDLGTIAVDAIYTPVKDVGYSVESTRVGDVTNFEKLTISVETDGTLTPSEAILQSVDILQDHLAIIKNGVENPQDDAPEEEAAEEESEEVAEEPAEESAEE